MIGLMHVLREGDGFYVSGAFWVTVMSLVALPVVVWIGWVAANPKRRLSYELRMATPLLNPEGYLQLNLEIRRGDAVLTAPYVVEVMLVSHGRLDISSDAFDRGRPLCLDVGADVLEVLQATTTTGYAIPNYSIDGSTLCIGPDRIGRRQRISFSLLVDGSAPVLTCLPSPLNNVEVRRQPDETHKPVPRRVVEEAVNAMVTVPIAVIAAVAIGGVTAVGGWPLVAAMMTIIAIGLAIWRLTRWLIRR